jgi:hypothetical protein
MKSNASHTTYQTSKHLSPNLTKVECGYQGDPIGEKFTLITHDEFNKFQIGPEYRQIRNKAAAASAAFKHVVENVLWQADGSLLMKALERSGITDIHKLVTITDAEIDNLQTNVTGVLTPLPDGLKSLPRIFRQYNEHRLRADYPINGGMWMSITDDDFNDFRIGEDYARLLDSVPMSRSATAFADLKHVVNAVLLQDDESLLMNALERDGFTDIGAFIAITDDEIEKFEGQCCGRSNASQVRSESPLADLSLLQRTSVS